MVRILSLDCSDTCHLRSTEPRRGITLLELLVAIGVIGILIGLLLPAVQQVRGSALRLSCGNTIRQIGLALHQFEASRGFFPPAPPVSDRGSPESRNGMSWQGLLLPFIEQGSLWAVSEAAFRMDPEAKHDPPHIGLATVVPLLTCPSDARLGAPQQTPSGPVAFTSYLGVTGSFTARWDGVLTGGVVRVRIVDVTDGTSNTLMVGERPPSNLFDTGAWYPGGIGFFEGVVMPVEEALFPHYHNCSPGPGGDRFRYGPGRIDNPCDVFHFWSLHPGGANFLFADGSVHFLPYSARSVMAALASRNGGESVALPF